MFEYTYGHLCCKESTYCSESFRKRYAKMLLLNVATQCCNSMLQRSVATQCCNAVLQLSAVLQRSVATQCCNSMLQLNVATQCCNSVCNSGRLCKHLSNACTAQIKATTY
jgi:hypothetical protein